MGNKIEWWNRELRLFWGMKLEVGGWIREVEPRLMVCDCRETTETEDWGMKKSWEWNLGFRVLDWEWNLETGRVNLRKRESENEIWPKAGVGDW